MSISQLVRIGLISVVPIADAKRGGEEGAAERVGWLVGECSVERLVAVKFRA